MSPIEQLLTLLGGNDRTGGDTNFWFMTVLILLTSVLALLYGRRFFWILAGLLGFVLGQVASQYIVTPLPIVATFFQLALGVIFGMLASAVQWPIAFVLAFLGGGAVGSQLSHALHAAWWVDWFAFLAMGTLALVVMRRFYAESLIVLSVLIGAAQLLSILRALSPELSGNPPWLVPTMLILTGLIFQGFELRRERRQPYLVPVSAGGLSQEDTE